MTASATSDGRGRTGRQNRGPVWSARTLPGPSWRSQGGEAVPAAGRGVRRLSGRLRRVRLRAPRQARAEAGEPGLGAGGGCPGLGVRRPSRSKRRGRPASRTDGADRRPSGGVGTFAVQLAKAFGADVTGVCRTGKLELVRSIGADRVIDYTCEDFADGAHRYDLILDTAGRRSLSHLRRALAPRGTLVLVGGEGGGRWAGGFDRQLRAVVLSLFLRQTLRSLISIERRQDLLFLKDLIEDGKMTSVVDRTYELDDAARRSPTPTRATAAASSSSPWPATGSSSLPWFRRVPWR